MPDDGTWHYCMMCQYRTRDLEELFTHEDLVHPLDEEEDEEEEEEETEDD